MSDIRTKNWGKIYPKLFVTFISIDNLEAGGYSDVYTHGICAYRHIKVDMCVHRSISISMSVILFSQLTICEKKLTTGTSNQVFFPQTHAHIYLKVAGKFDRHDAIIIFGVVSNQSSGGGCALHRPSAQLLFAYPAFSYLSAIGYWWSIF